LAISSAIVPLPLVRGSPFPLLYSKNGCDGRVHHEIQLLPVRGHGLKSTNASTNAAAAVERIWSFPDASRGRAFSGPAGAEVLRLPCLPRSGWRIRSRATAHRVFAGSVREGMLRAGEAEFVSRIRHGGVGSSFAAPTTWRSGSLLSNS
jgi:hypothetical protein